MPSTQLIPVELTIAQNATESDIQEIQNPVDGAYAIAGLRLHTTITAANARLQMSPTSSGASFVEVYDAAGALRNVAISTAGYYALPPGDYAFVDRFIRMKLSAGASVATKITVFLRVA